MKIIVDEYPYYASDCPFCKVDYKREEDHECRIDGCYCPVTNLIHSGSHEPCGKLTTMSDMFIGKKVPDDYSFEVGM